MKRDSIRKSAEKLSKKHKNFPYVKISKSTIKNEIKKLEELNINDYILPNSQKAQFANKLDYKGKKLFTIKASKTGNLISNLFFQRQRMKASMAQHKSPTKIWGDKKKKIRLFEGMIKLNKHSLEYNEAQLRSSMRLYFSVVPQFKVSTAKIIYEYFNAKRVLDFSAGWGDRLTAFLSCKNTKSYIGIDPNKNLENSYKRLIKFYREYTKFQSKQNSKSKSTKEIEMIFKPAENVKLDKKFDLIFTSPPYFELEKYSDKKNQSNIKYKNLDTWLDEFLFTVLDNNLPNLTGTLALQISDYKKGNKIIKIVEPLQDYMKKNWKNFKYKGIISVSTKGRFQQNILEPIFIWQNI